MKGMSMIHLCPREGESATRCCGQLIFELPFTDRLTLDPALVTCRRADVCTPCMVQPAAAEDSRGPGLTSGENSAGVKGDGCEDGRPQPQ